MPGLNTTHEAGRRSWVESANDRATDFPLQNLPHGVFSRAGGARRGGVAIGDMILDMAGAAQAGLFRADLSDVARMAGGPELNALLAADADAVSALRARIQQLLEKGAPEEARVSELLVPMSEADLHLPARIGAFTDFMTSAPHIVGPRPARPEGGKLPPCFWSLPIAYNSRASSVVVSGLPLERPHGQYPVQGEAVFGPTSSLDFELEFACMIGRGNPLGQPIRLDEARAHIFGYCLLNDWSARDFQWWESVLGPFQAKAFRTTISPWIVTAEALTPFRKPLPARPEGAPRPPIHLDSATNEADGGLSIRFAAHLTTPTMRKDGAAPFHLTDTRFDTGAWSFEQMITHHAIGGCNLQPGDLLSSGTLSGEALESAGCLAERTGGRVPVELPHGETRLWLEDGDELVITGRAEREEFASIGFGPCAARVMPAVPLTPTS
jgi:fumarylacetoacetase